MSSTFPCAVQVSGLDAEHDAALLSSRVEVLTVQLERERADHRRELRRKAQELQEVCSSHSSSSFSQLVGHVPLALDVSIGANRSYHCRWTLQLAVR